MSPTSWKLLVLGVVVLWCSRPRASSAEEKASAPAAAAPVAVVARSVGFPNRGTLEGGVRLEPSDAIRAPKEHRWGLPALVGLVERAAARVADRHAGSVLLVGDLSRADGGEIGGHDSHETGRDVDLGFYLLRDGVPFVTDEYLVIDREGAARGAKGVTFDDERNWALLAALLSDRESPGILQVFVAKHLQTRLLREARRVRAPEAIVARARTVMLQPRVGQRHDDHFHVRIRCPKGQRDCINFPAKRFFGAAGATKPAKTAPKANGKGRAKPATAQAKTPRSKKPKR